MHHLESKRFGRLVAVKTIGSNRNNQRLWLCLCDCGKTKHAIASSLVRGLTASCGCLHHDVMVTRNTTHGKTNSPEYKTWIHMRRRCYDPSDNRFPLYGAIGITVCKRWLDFDNFLADMGEKPSPRHTIDRIKNTVGYRPSNCRWATAKIQGRNKKSNRLVVIGGISRCVSEWAEKYGRNSKAIYARIYAGWSGVRAVTTPIRSHRA